MKQILVDAPPNSLFFISDFGEEVIPDIDKRSLFLWWTKSCVVVGCLMDQDGSTELVLSDEPGDVRTEAPIFDGPIETPNKTIMISNSARDVLLQQDTVGQVTRVRVWTNRFDEPDKIWIVIE